VKDPTSRTDLTADEVDAQHGEELPEREAMSVVDANAAAPLNAAAALNVLSEDSTAVSNAEQTAEIEQSTGS
jgi:hypothetical protein